MLADPAEADAKGEVERLSREQLADIAEVGFVTAASRVTIMCSLRVQQAPRVAIMCVTAACAFPPAAGRGHDGDDAALCRARLDAGAHP